MEKISFEKEVLQYLNLPSVPKKKWNGKDSFKEGVAVISMRDESKSYAVAAFDAEKDESPRIRKVFSQEPFVGVGDIFVVPSYMDTVEDVQDMDLDKESKEAALRLAEEAKELEDEGVESEGMKEMKALPEWVFDEVHNLDEGIAYIKAFNQKNKIKGKVPSKEEAVKLRLLTIYNEISNKNK